MILSQVNCQSQVMSFPRYPDALQLWGCQSGYCPRISQMREQQHWPQCQTFSSASCESCRCQTSFHSLGPESSNSLFLSKETNPHFFSLKICTQTKKKPSHLGLYSVSLISQKQNNCMSNTHVFLVTQKYKSVVFGKKV